VTAFGAQADRRIGALLQISRPDVDVDDRDRSALIRLTRPSNHFTGVPGSQAAARAAQ
jgi:hypothetical protein